MPPLAVTVVGPEMMKNLLFGEIVSEIFEKEGNCCVSMKPARDITPQNTDLVIAPDSVSFEGQAHCEISTIIKIIRSKVGAKVPVIIYLAVKKREIDESQYPNTVFTDKSYDLPRIVRGLLGLG